VTLDVERLTAAPADRYRIKLELGTGGMATVCGGRAWLSVRRG
jgi:hypothetical protein